MVICLQRGAYDLHMVQLMPLPPHHLLLRYNRDRFDLSGAGLPRSFWKRGRETGVCLSVCLSVRALSIDVRFGALQPFPGQSLSRTRHFPEKRFPDKLY